MAFHIIVGAGLGGLYTGSRLINLGVDPENIIMIEKRKANHYTRPGHLGRSTFVRVQNQTNIQISPSSALHIKELERAMYAHLRHLNVVFREEEFLELCAKTDVLGKVVKTRDQDGRIIIYQADYVFDCTGKKAHVAQAVNIYQQSMGADQFFKTALLVDINPIPDHLVAYVFTAHRHFLKDFLQRNGEIKVVPDHIRQAPFEKQIEIKEKLVALGWFYETFPTFYAYSANVSKRKVYLYMETPQDLAQSQQQAWIQLLMNIYSSHQEIIKDYQELQPSRKYGKKPRIISFKNTPYVLNKAIYESDDLPTVIVGFDALKGFDYRLANAVNSGIDCFEYVAKHVTITGGSIQCIDSVAIEKDVFHYLNTLYKPKLVSLLTCRQNAIESGLSYFSHIYASVAMRLSSVESFKKHTYQMIAGQLAYQAALAEFFKLATRKRSVVLSIDALNKCLKLLLRARNRLLVDQLANHQDVEDKLQSIHDDLSSKIDALDPEQDLVRVNMSAEKLNDLLESMLQNLQKMPNSNMVQDKIRLILGQISNHVKKKTDQLPEFTAKAIEGTSAMARDRWFSCSEAKENTTGAFAINFNPNTGFC